MRIAPVIVWAPLAACIVVSGCASTPAYRFSCPGGAELRATYAHDTAFVRLPTGAAALPVARSGSGARYANDTLEFWEHAGVVRVTKRTGSPPTDSLMYQDCRAEQ